MADHKIQVRIGNAEFSAEGEQSVVGQQFEKFLEALRTVGQPQGGHPDASRRSGSDPNKVQPPAEVESNDELLTRVFANEDRALSLRVLPTGERADGEALLLLLYGFLKLRGESSVLAGQLMMAAKQSGANVRRVDVSLLQRDLKDLVTQAGRKSGKRYGLNNRGIARAESLLATLLQ